MVEHEDDDAGVCPIGGRQKGWSLVTGFGYNFAVDILSRMIQPGTGLDCIVKSVTETKRTLPNIANMKIVSMCYVRMYVHCSGKYTMKLLVPTRYNIFQLNYNNNNL